MSATNPESGTVTYAYDANGNLTHRLAGTVQTVYSFDALNQLSYKTCNTGPAPWVSYTYN